MKKNLITGASNGIGAGLAKAYLNLGFEVFNFDIEVPSDTTSNL